MEKKKVDIKIYGKHGSGCFGLGFALSDLLQNYGFDCKFEQDEMTSRDRAASIPDLVEKVIISISVVQLPRTS